MSETQTIAEQAPRVELRTSWMQELNWLLLSTGISFLAPVQLHTPRGTLKGVQVTALVTSSNVELGRGAASAGSDAREVALELTFEWYFKNSLIFLDDASPVPGELHLTISYPAPAGPHVFRLPPLPVRVLSPLQWDCGLRVSPSGRCALLSEIFCWEIEAEIPAVGNTIQPNEMFRSLTTQQAEAVVSGIAALVNPRHPRIVELGRSIVEQVRGSEGNVSAMDLLSSSVGQEKLFRTLCAQIGAAFRYSQEPVSFAKGTQRVRTPADLLADGAGSLTCIDVVLIAAAACEELGMTPVVMLVSQGSGVHALCALWKYEARLPGTPPVFQIGQQTKAELLALDFTEQSNVDAAAKRAETLLAAAFGGAELVIGIDVVAAHGRFAALPLHGAPLAIADAVFPKQYAQQAPLSVRRHTRDLTDLANSAASADEIFVPLFCTRRDDPYAGPFEARTWLAPRTAGQSRRVAVLANSGAGKSYLLARRFLDELGPYVASHGAARIPVFFPLSRYDHARGEPILEQLNQWLRIHGYPLRDNQAFIEEVKQGRFTFFLDALDEMKIHVGAQVEKLLEPLEPLFAIPAADIVLSARTGLFGAKAANLLRDWQILDLHEWRSNNWSAFLDQHVAKNRLTADEANRLRTIQEPISSLTSRPLYCKMIVQEREHVLRKEILNVAHLFRRYVHRFWTRRPVAVEFLTDPVHKNVCMQEIAYKMEQENRSAWTVDALADYVNRKRPDLGGFDDWKSYLLAIRVYSFLDTSTTIDYQEQFYFSHEAFREYFLAEYLLRSLKAEDLGPLHDIDMSMEVVRLVADLAALEPERLDVDGLSLRAPANFNVQRTLALLAIVRDGRCPPLWDLDRAVFSGLQLQRTNFSDCHLEHADFISCDLQGCRFDRAKLEAARFQDCKIADASFYDVDICIEQFVECEGIPRLHHG